ncbi:MAG: hypothetical protein IJW01_00790 [Paludibacteraceae bacterium]|nr:hypothetical protein [Paludibacteraceae bacterium]
MNKSIQKLKCKFAIVFASIFVFLVCIYILYRAVFNGKLSHEISDWTAFVNIFNGIGVFLLTALNVWIFYKLTILIAEDEEKHRLYGLKKDILNNFNRTIYAVFSPDVEDPVCEINRELLGKVYHKLKLMKEVYSPICEEFSSDECVSFLKEFHEFCLNFFQEESIEPQGKNMDEEAYKIFIKALKFEMKIGKEIGENK